MKLKYKILTVAIISVIAILITAWIIHGNITVDLSEYTVSASDLPEGFDGFRIVQVSDLHNSEYGERNEKLLDMIAKARPDMIAITGDLIDSSRPDVALALHFAEEAMKIAPCYYVPGNHESRLPDEYEILKQGLIKLGVTVLENSSVKLKIGEEYITVAGVIDPAFVTDYYTGDSEGVMKDSLCTLPKDDSYTLLLSHRPELFSLYVDAKVDLALTGHAHGGQIRLPIIGGVAAPGQGLFPKYDHGYFSASHTSMIVSRGLDKAVIFPRINNRPELVLIKLKREL